MTTLQDFLSTSQQQADRERFNLENPYTLEIDVQGHAWAKLGSRIAHRGDIRFSRQGMFEKGVGQALKSMVTGEGMALMKCEGHGTVYVADSGKRISLVRLQNESITINGNDVLAIEESLDWDIRLTTKMAGIMAGGLFNVAISGTGWVAFTTHGQPLVLAVQPGAPVFTDPQATVAWDSSLIPKIRTDFSFRTLLGRGSEESIQMEFDGHGFVVLQPYEERPVTTQKG